MNEYRLPETLRKLMKKKNITQRNLAMQMNISPFAVHKWLNFKCMPSVFSVMEIAKIFNVTIDYLIYGDKK